MFDYPLFRAITIATNGKFPQFTKRFVISGIKDPCVIQFKANSDHCEFQRVHYVRILESMIYHDSFHEFVQAYCSSVLNFGSKHLTVDYQADVIRPQIVETVPLYVFRWWPLLYL